MSKGPFAVERALQDELHIRPDEANKIVYALNHADFVIVEKAEFEYLQQRASDLDDLERAGQSD